MTAPSAQHETWTPELSFAARLAIVRHQMGWNIKEAALACGFRPQSWRGWELEGRLPHDIRNIIDTIAERTGVDPDWLFRAGPMRGTKRGQQPKREYARPTGRPADRRPTGHARRRTTHPNGQTTRRDVNRPASKSQRVNRLATRP